MSSESLSSLNAWMDQTVARLKEQLSNAYASISSGFAWGVASDLEDQQRGALDQVQRYVVRLDGELRQQVISGSLSYERWQGIAQQQSDLISSTVGQEVPTLAGFWNQVVTPTATEVKDGVTSAAKAIESSLPFYVAAAVLGLIALAVISVRVR